MKIFEILENIEMFSKITAKRIFIDVKSMDKPTYYGSTYELYHCLLAEYLFIKGNILQSQNYSNFFCLI